jgi:hypothetical protein
MNAKTLPLAGLLIVGLLAAATPVSADPADQGNCIGQSVENGNPEHGTDCTGVCSDQNPDTDHCTGVCTDGSCDNFCGLFGDLIPACNQQERADTRAINVCDFLLSTGAPCIGIDHGCYRIVPKTTLYDPTTGQPMITIDEPAELCY